MKFSLKPQTNLNSRLNLLDLSVAVTLKYELKCLVLK